MLISLNGSQVKYIRETIKRIKALQDKVSVKRKNISIGKETIEKFTFSMAEL